MNRFHYRGTVKMIEFKPHDQSFGNIAQALAEARALVAALEDAYNVQSYFREFPQATAGLCSPRGSEVLIDVFTHKGQLRIICKETLVEDA